MKDKNINIESYEGEDSFYTGSEDDYEEFLKSVEGKINLDSAEPVEDTRKINLSETINLHGVIDKFKKKAGEFAKASKKFTNDVAEQIAAKTAAVSENSEIPKNNAKADDEDDDVTKFEKVTTEPDDESVSFNVDAIKSEIKDTVKGSISKLENFGEGLASITARFDATDKKLSELEHELNDANNRLRSVVTASDDAKKDRNRTVVEIKSHVNELMNKISDVQQTVNGVSKLTDSVFDLKNTQLNTKKSIEDLEMSFNRLKKKCVLGITILSILAAISIALQVVTLLS